MLRFAMAQMKMYCRILIKMLLGVSGIFTLNYNHDDSLARYKARLGACSSINNKAGTLLTRSDML